MARAPDETPGLLAAARVCKAFSMHFDLPLSICSRHALCAGDRRVTCDREGSSLCRAWPTVWKHTVKGDIHNPMEKLPHKNQAPIIFIGDSNHPMTPYSGEQSRPSESHVGSRHHHVRAPKVIFTPMILPKVMSTSTMVVAGCFMLCRAFCLLAVAHLERSAQTHPGWVQSTWPALPVLPAILQLPMLDNIETCGRSAARQQRDLAGIMAFLVRMLQAMEQTWP